LLKLWERGLFKDMEKDFAINLAKKAGEIIRKDFRLEKEGSRKEDSTILTKTDTSINQFIIDSVKDKFPGHNVLAEEGNFSSPGSEYTWVCDPVDGTLVFSKGIPVSTFSLALVKNGESILGVAYDPFLDNLFVAEKGKGAFLNDKKISVSSMPSLEKATIGFSWQKRHALDLSDVYLALKEKQSNILTLGSAVYMGTLVALGKFDAYISSFGYPYEAAALKVIVEEAGGKVTDIFGKEQPYDKQIKGFLVSNGLLHEELLKLVDGQ